MRQLNKCWPVTTLSSLLFWGMAPNLQASAKPIGSTMVEPTQVAQLFYPPADQQKLVRVIGQGNATQPADVAELELLLQETNDLDEGSLNRIRVSPTTFQEVSSEELRLVSTAELTAADFEPLIKVISKAAGISPKSVKVNIPKSERSFSPFPFPNLGGDKSLSVRFAINQPTPDKLETVTLAVEEHLQANPRLALDDIKVDFKINQCEELKLQAFEAAVQDAQKRAETIAEAMNATLSSNASVAEPFFNLFVPPGCSSEQGFSLLNKKDSYEPGDPIEVVVSRVIFFTYTLEK